MTAVCRHIRWVEESMQYYQKKRNEGKRHNQSITALGRHMVRVIWSLVKNDNYYENRKQNIVMEVKKEPIPA